MANHNPIILSYYIYTCVYIYSLQAPIDTHKHIVISREKMMRTKIVFVLYFTILLPLALAQLNVGFYKTSCPRAESIVKAAVQKRFNTDKSITAALLRMHFHDCFVRVSALLNLFVGSYSDLILYANESLLFM